MLNIKKAVMIASLVVGISVLGTQSASAMTTISGNVVLDNPGTGYVPPYNGNMLTGMSGTTAPYTITIDASHVGAYPSAYMLITNPCSASNPVDLNTEINYTARQDADPSVVGDSDFFFVIANDLVSAPLGQYASPNLSSIINTPQVANLSITGLTGSQLFIGLADQGWSISNSLGDIIDINSFTYTITYDETSPNCNTSPIASNVSVTASPSGSSEIVDASQYIASDREGDPLSFQIASGNSSGYFSIDPSTGAISRNASIIPVGVYSLMVDVSDGRGGVTQVLVTVTIHDSPIVTDFGPPAVPNTGIGKAVSDLDIAIIPAILLTVTASLLVVRKIGTNQ